VQFSLAFSFFLPLQHPVLEHPPPAHLFSSLCQTNFHTLCSNMQNENISSAQYQ
jgi:hypothetical protein